MWVGRTETFLRRSAAVAIAYPCVPKAVVRMATRTGIAVGQDNPRVSPAIPVRVALVNVLGPRTEVRWLTPPPGLVLSVVSVRASDLGALTSQWLGQLSFGQLLVGTGEWGCWTGLGVSSVAGRRCSRRAPCRHGRHR